MKALKKFLCVLLSLCFFVSAASAQTAALRNSESFSIQNLSISMPQASSAAAQLLALEDCTLIAALYAPDGRLLTAGACAVEGSGQPQQVSLPLSDTGAEFETAKAFLVDSTSFAPLCESFSTTATRQRIAALDLPDVWKQELIHAESLGLPMDKLEQETITGKEMAVLLDSFVSWADSDKLAQWEALLPTLRSYHQPLTRFDAMAALFLAARTLGDGWADFKEDFFGTMLTLQFPWDDYYFTEGLYAGIDSPQYEVPGMGSENYLDGACLYYNFSRPSAYSGQFPFAYDADANSIHEYTAPGYAECVLAVVRLISSEYPELFGTLPAGQADSTILTEQLIEKAQDNPVVTAEDHPQWTGFVLGWDEDVYYSATVENIQHIAQWGFNSVRIMIDYRNLFNPDDVTVGNSANLRTLDRLVAAAIEHDIHLNICLCKLPGRIAIVDPDSYTSTGEFDLFINEERQKEVDTIWSALSQRYQEIPSATLSFTPFWEALNYNLSTGLPYPEYTPADVGSYLSRIIDVIRAQDSDRLIIYEATAVNDPETTIAESAPIKAAVADRENVMISYNFCENPYVYASMTATEGEHIDNNNHSIPLPGYPTCYYAAHKTVFAETALTLDGFLPAGTVIDLYLEESFGGSIEVMADSQSLYTEELGAAQYNVGYQLSRQFPYAASDKCVSVTLSEDTALVTISSTDGFAWCGMDVTLPEAYAIDQWWYISSYDVFLGVEETEGVTQKHTSRIIISPTDGWGSREITIHQDVSYTTTEIREQSNSDTIDNWCQIIEDFDGNCMVRIEAAEFSGAVWEDVKAYYEDVLSSFTRYGYSWWNNEFWLLTNEYPQTIVVAECPSQPYDGFDHFNLELLELLQKYIPASNNSN